MWVTLVLACIVADDDPWLGAPELEAARASEALGEEIGARAVPLEGSLPGFFAALAALEKGSGSGPVRIVHLGDSQIASDYITNVVRRRLVLRFGSGGRGFLLIDRQTRYLDSVPRAGVASPGWRFTKIPEPRSNDNIYGFTGINYIADASGQHTSFALGDTRTAELFFLTTPRSGTLSVDIDDEPSGEISLRAPVHGASELIDVPQGSKTLRLTSRGSARLYGVALENGLPGVVYDAIGVPGAGFDYFAGIDRDAFVDQLARRGPALVILQLAGAEVYRMSRGWTAPEAVTEAALELVARVRAAAPQAECLILGPLSRATAETGEPRAETAAITAALRAAAKQGGCAFWDMLAAMGGVDAAARWQKLGLMNGDLVHPRSRGAAVLGHLLHRAISDAYQASGAAPTREPLDRGLRNAALLERAFTKLRALESEKRGRFLVAQLGASHTAWQQFTDAARAALTARFGDAGRGFVDIAGNQTPWRRAGVVRRLRGRWQTHNALHGATGPLGLAGQRLEGLPGASLTLDLCTGCERGGPPAEIELLYIDEPAAGRLSVTLDGKRVASLTPEATAAAAKILPLPVRGTAHDLAVKNDGPGSVSLLGAVVEKRTPGVVYDVLGLPGATAFVADTFDKPAFQAQLAARKADLYVLFYGTNEAMLDDFSDEAYRTHYASFLTTIRAASPEADCVILGATDRMRPSESGALRPTPAQNKVTAALERIAAENRCAFWPTIAHMGGTGAIDRWARAEPALARGDRVHLTEAGYGGLARAFIRDLLAACDNYMPRGPRRPGLP